MHSNHVGRKLIAVTPVLLICGIIAQVVLLMLAVMLYVPLLIWPEMLDKPYRIITKGMARIMARSIMGHRENGQKGSKDTEKQFQLSFRDRTRPVRCLRPGVSACYDGITQPT
jgi:hypothetical protein